MHSDEDIEYLEDLLWRGTLPFSVMLPSEFDGLVAGVLLCPGAISPKDWVPLVLGNPEELRDLDPVEGQEILDALVAHYNRVAENFITKSSPYEAMIPFTEDDEAHWDLWIEGFAAVMDLIPEAFEQYADVPDEYTEQAFSGLLMLVGCANGDLDLSDEEMSRIDTVALDLIPSIVVHLYLWLEQFGAPNGPIDELRWEDVMMPLLRKTRH